METRGKRHPTAKVDAGRKWRGGKEEEEGMGVKWRGKPKTAKTTTNQFQAAASKEHLHRLHHILNVFRCSKHKGIWRNRIKIRGR
jgi:hypothetical protein